MSPHAESGPSSTSSDRPGALAAFFAVCPICSSTARTPRIEYTELRFVRCSDCGLLYKSDEDPQLSARLTQRYDADYFIKGRAQYLKRWDHRVAKCRRQLLMCLEFAPHAKSAIDVGCSAGYVLEAAKSLGLHPTGIDYAAWTANLAHERGYDTAAASLSELPFRDGSFDILTAKHTLEHVRWPKEGLSEISRVLKPGGVALIVVPDAAYWRPNSSKSGGKYFHPERLGWQHHVYYTVDALSRGLRGAGLEVVSTDKAMLRRRLAKGLGAPWEYVRWAALKTWTTTSRLTHTRREIQLIARKPSPG